MSTSYPDTLSLYIRAWRLRQQAETMSSYGRLREAYDLLVKALEYMVKALLLYRGRKPLGVKDPVYLTSMALDEGLLSPEEYSLIVGIFVERNLEEKMKKLYYVIGLVEEKLRSLDPYLDSQMKLFRY